MISQLPDVFPSRWKLSWRGNVAGAASWVVFVREGMEQSRNEGCRAHSKCKAPLVCEFVNWGGPGSSSGPGSCANT